MKAACAGSVLPRICLSLIVVVPVLKGQSQPQRPEPAKVPKVSCALPGVDEGYTGREQSLPNLFEAMGVPAALAPLAQISKDAPPPDADDQLQQLWKQEMDRCKTLATNEIVNKLIAGHVLKTIGFLSAP